MELKGRKSLLEQLKRPVKAGRAAHAMIFAGPSGSGRHSAALWMAQGFNCLEAPEKRPCGRCPECRRMLSGSANELIEIEPDGESARSIKIETARALIERISIRPEGRVKCVIIREADKMTIDAQDALLKTFEEPPPYVAFFLITERPTALLPTVRSRCVTLRFAPLKMDEVRSYLIRQQNLLPDEAERLAHLSGGCIGKALLWISDARLNQWHDKICEVFKDFAAPKDVARAGAALGAIAPKPAQKAAFASFLSAMLELSAGELMRQKPKTQLAGILLQNGLDAEKLLSAIMEFNRLRAANINIQYAVDALLYGIVM